MKISTPFETFIFVHIEKCGGSTIRDMIYRELCRHIPDARLHIPGINCPNEENVVALKPERQKELKQRHLFCVADHSHYGLAAERLGLQNPFYLTILRKPMERIISHYYFFHAPGLGCNLTDLPEKSLIQGLESEITNLMTIKLAGYHQWRNDIPYKKKRRLLEKLLPIAKTNLRHIPVVGLLEALPQAIEQLNQTNPFGFTFELKEKKNVNLHDKPVNEKVLAAIKSYSEYDLELYRFARERMQTT